MLVAQGVHRVPELRVTEGHEFSVGGQLLERFALKRNCVATDVTEHRRLEDEKSAVNPAIGIVRFLGEADNRVSLEFQAAKPGRRSDCGYCRFFPVAAMK